MGTRKGEETISVFIRREGAGFYFWIHFLDRNRKRLLPEKKKKKKRGRQFFQEEDKDTKDTETWNQNAESSALPATKAVNTGGAAQEK